MNKYYLLWVLFLCHLRYPQHDPSIHIVRARETLNVMVTGLQAWVQHSRPFAGSVSPTRTVPKQPSRTPPSQTRCSYGLLKPLLDSQIASPTDLNCPVL